MASTLGTPLPRQRTGHVYLFAALGLAVVSAIGAFRGKYGWGLTEGALGFAAIFYVLPWLSRRRRENVQVDDKGVIVVTDKGREEVLWADVTRVRITTTSAGPWGEDVWFVLEGPEGKGCIVPHDAVVRTKLLEEMQERLAGVDDRKVMRQWARRARTPSSSLRAIAPALKTISNGRALYWQGKVPATCCC